MEDQVETTEPETDAAEDPAEVEEVVDADETAEPDSDEEQPEQPEEVGEEVEYEGKKYRVAPELRDALMLRADYTRKTQELAAHRATVEQEQAKFIEAQRTHQQLGSEVTDLQIMGKQLEAFRNLDWRALAQEDPHQHSALMAQYTMLRDQRDEAGKKVNARVQQLELEAQRQYAERVERANAEMRTYDPAWSPDKASKLKEFARSVGFSDHDIETSVSVDPRIAKVLSLALLGHQATSKQRVIPLPKPKPVVPASKVGGRAARPTGPRDDMSMKEWVKARESQLRQG